MNPKSTKRRDFYSTLKQSTPDDKKNRKTRKFRNRSKNTNEENTTRKIRKKYALLSRDLFQNSITTSNSAYAKNVFDFNSIPTFNWKDGVKYTGV